MLEAFVVVAEELHFGRAAKRLHLSQPPLSKSIQKLETQLGVKLFTRSTRSVALTSAGTELLWRIRRLQEDSVAMELAVRQAARGEIGRLTIGLTPSASYSNIPDILYEFRRRYPTVFLELREMNSSEMPDALYQRKLDLALIRPPFADPDLSPCLLYDEPMMVAMRSDHPLATRRTLTIKQVLDHDLIGYSRHHSRYFSQILQLMIGAQAKPARIVMESMIPTILTLVAAGFGIAVVPASLAQARGDTLAYISLRGTGVLRAELFVAKQPLNDNPAVNRFMEVVEEMRRTRKKA